VSERRDESPAPAEGTPRRRPYEKPAFSWEDDLGTRPGLIAVCNKTAPLVGSCDTGSLQS
jgi:hypothetical protein